MPRRRRTEKAKPHSEISDGLLAFLNDEPIAESDSETLFQVCMLTAGNGEPGLRALWKRARGEVLPGWILKNPGRRPRIWWAIESPRQLLGRFPGCGWDGELCEPRRLLRGAGVPAWAVMAHVPAYSLGLPTLWAGFEESNPPVFESQSAYL